MFKPRDLLVFTKGSFINLICRIISIDSYDSNYCYLECKNRFESDDKYHKLKSRMKLTNFRLLNNCPKYLVNNKNE